MRDKALVERKNITTYRKGLMCKPYFSTGKQQGMAVLTIVAILLSVVTFSTITTSQNVQQYYAIQKIRQDSASSRAILKKQLKRVAMALRTKSISTVLSTTSNPNL